MAFPRSQTNRNRMIAYSFLFPNIVGFMIFTFVPAFASLLLSFYDWNGFGAFRFVGFENFTRMWNDENFTVALMNTLLYSVLYVPFTLFFALLISIALNKGVRGVKWFRTAVFMPYITATIAVAVVWQLLLNPSKGPINGFLTFVGIAHPPGWLIDPDWAMVSVSMISIWQSVGYYMVFFLAGLQGIPSHLYEAAEIDGAGVWRKFVSVTVPMLSPVIFFTLIIAIINSFKVFDFVYILTQGGPGRSTNVLVYDIYNTGFKQFEFGYASAKAYILFAIVIVITLVQFRSQKKWVTY